MKDSIPIEHELIIAMRNGDKRAFIRFYDLFEKRVYRLAFSYFNNKEDAEEITQDVFLKIYKSSAGFRGTANINTWVYRITVNKCLDKLRFNKAVKRFSFFSFLSSDDKMAQETIADSGHHGIEADKKEDVNILWSAIEKLPLQQRTAIVLTQLEELSGKEAADVMGTTAKAVEGLITRGKVNMRSILANIYDKTREVK